MKNIQIASVTCDHKEHQGQNIRLLCLKPDCNLQSAFCFKCSIKGHLQCRDFVKEPEEIQKELIELDSLYTDMVQLQEQIHKQFSVLLSKIEQLIKPIIQYKKTPNLTNLNLIGNMLKQTTTTTKTIKENIKQSLDNIKQVIINNGTNYNEPQNEAGCYFQSQDCQVYKLQSHFDSSQTVQSCQEQKLTLNHSRIKILDAKQDTITTVIEQK